MNLTVDGLWVDITVLEKGLVCVAKAVLQKKKHTDDG